MAAAIVKPTASDRSNAVTLAVLGMISGAISWALIDLADPMNLYFEVKFLGLVLWPISVYPGFVFGLIVAGFLRFRAKVSWMRAVGYFFAAGLGYFAAFHVAFYIITGGSEHDAAAWSYILGGVPGGFVGSLLLGLLSIPLLQVPGRLTLRGPVAIGTAAGALLVFGSFDDRNGLGFLAFFVLWQGAYGASLAPLLRGTAHSPARATISGS